MDKHTNYSCNIVTIACINYSKDNTSIILFCVIFIIDFYCFFLVNSCMQLDFFYFWLGFVSAIKQFSLISYS